MNNYPSYVFITYIIEGTGKLELGFTNIKVAPGELYVIPLTGSELSRAVESKPQFCLLENIHCTESLGEAAPLLPMKWKILKKHQEEFVKLLKLMSYHQKEANSIMSTGFVSIWTAFMEFLLSAPKRAELQTFDEDNLTIHKALHLIGNSFMNRTSVGEISRQVAMSTRQFQRKFNALTGRTYKQFLQEIRIRHSCGLLMFTSLNVQTIAEYVGIYDMYHFYRLFREYCGMTPAAFRQLDSLF